MKITTSNNLKQTLILMKEALGSKTLINEQKVLASQHRNIITSCFLDIDYNSIFGDNTNAAVLGTGRLGSMVLGKNS
jgi:hypothetical protein